MTTLPKPPPVFWGEVTPCEHLAEFYTEESEFLASLQAFVGEGLAVGEAVVVIATATHLSSLEMRLREAGFDLPAMLATQQYLPLDAATTLSRFMRNGWPDEALFARTIGELLQTARGEGRRVRAFGEMVALLWAQGHSGATVRLEHLWNDLCASGAFALFCAYPRIGQTRNLSHSLAEVCALHSQVAGLKLESGGCEPA